MGCAEWEYWSGAKAPQETAPSVARRCILRGPSRVASHMQAVQTKAEVIARLQAQREPLRALGVAQLGLFGSFVRDEAGPESDVDLLVDFQEGRKTYRAICAVGDLLEDVLGRSVEILTRPGLSRYIGPHIIRTTEHVLSAA